ncbi:hypothetical protein ETD83_38825, partial [Actinomadura soli]
MPEDDVVLMCNHHEGGLVRAQDNGKERDRGNGPEGHRPHTPQVPGWAARVLSLQRLAGNAAVSRRAARRRGVHRACPAGTGQHPQ